MLAVSRHHKYHDFIATETTRHENASETSLKEANG